MRRTVVLLIVLLLFPTTAHAATWSKSKVSKTLTAACDHYGIKGSDKAWLVSKGVRIAYRESTYRTHARNGSCLGLFQFNSGWGAASKRLDGKWSCYRFVRVYRDGGVSAIRRHWRATY